MFDEPPEPLLGFVHVDGGAPHEGLRLIRCLRGQCGRVLAGVADRPGHGGGRREQEPVVGVVSPPATVPAPAPAAAASTSAAPRTPAPPTPTAAASAAATAAAAAAIDVRAFL